MVGSLAGLCIVEIAGIGPAPFAGMMLADAGADVIVVDRLQSPSQPRSRDDLMRRGRRSVAVDLKHPEGREVVLRLAEASDGFIEGFRPGVVERLGIGPEPCLERNPRLVYGRMTGWGQEGPLAHTAGHDINFIALTGALDAIGRAGEAPVPPLNLLGDFGGGGLLLAYGMVCALFETTKSGRGQVVDASMVDGAALLTTFIHGLRAMGFWNDERGTNLVDTGAHFYNTYETEDRKFVAVGAIEERFYAEMLRRLEIAPNALPAKMDRARWPEATRALSAVFRTKTRDEWCTIFDGTDACVTPVLSWSEAADHPHNIARRTFVKVDGCHLPGPAPRFSRTAGTISRRPPEVGEHSDEILLERGFSEAEIAQFRDMGAIG